MQFLPMFSAFSALFVSNTSISKGTLIAVELVLAVALIVFAFIFKSKLAKLFCVCGTEICLWLACDLAFPDTIITQIMTWVTAFVSIVIVIAVVNHIDWSNLRGRKNK